MPSIATKLPNWMRSIRVYSSDGFQDHYSSVRWIVSARLSFGSLAPHYEPIEIHWCHRARKSVRNEAPSLHSDQLDRYSMVAWRHCLTCAYKSLTEEGLRICQHIHQARKDKWNPDEVSVQFLGMKWIRSSQDSKVLWISISDGALIAFAISTCNISHLSMMMQGLHIFHWRTNQGKGAYGVQSCAYILLRNHSARFCSMVTASKGGCWGCNTQWSTICHSRWEDNIGCMTKETSEAANFKKTKCLENAYWQSQNTGIQVFANGSWFVKVSALKRKWDSGLNMTACKRL